MLQTLESSGDMAEPVGSTDGQPDRLQIMENYLDEALSGISQDGPVWQVETKSGFFREETTLTITGNLSMIREHPYRIALTSRSEDMRLFRDRVDLALEKLKAASEEKNE